VYLTQQHCITLTSSTNAELIVDVFVEARVAVVRRPRAVAMSVTSLEADTARGAALSPNAPTAVPAMHCVKRNKVEHKYLHGVSLFNPFKFLVKLI